MATDPNELFCVGVVKGTHGLRGDLKIRPSTDDSTSLLEARELYFRHPEREIVRHVPARAKMHKGQVLLRLVGLESIDEVQHLVGWEVLMAFGDLAELEEDEYYWYQLEGMTVVDRTRGELGTLEEMFTTAAHDVYVVRGRYGEVLVPAVAAMVLRVDLESRRMDVDLPEGLVPEANDV